MIPEEVKQAIFESKVFLIKLGFILLIALSTYLCFEFVYWILNIQDQNPVIEIVGEVLESQTGIDIDD